MADNDGSSLLRYMVEDPEAFAQNLAKAIEQAGKAAAAYLKPRETGETSMDMSADLANVTKTLAHVGEYWLADPARTIAVQSKLVSGWMDLWSTTLKRMSGEPVTPVAEPDPKDKRFQDPEWRDNAFFDFLKQFYLITSRWAVCMEFPAIAHSLKIESLSIPGTGSHLTCAARRSRWNSAPLTNERVSP